MMSIKRKMLSANPSILMRLYKFTVMLFMALILSGCMIKNSFHSGNSNMLTAEQVKGDLDYLFQTIEVVHPDVDFYVPEKDFSKRKQNLYKKLDRAVSLEEFYRIVSPVVNVLKDEHTMIYPPRGKCPEEQRRYAKKIYKDIKGNETVYRNTYKIIREKSICILKFNTCGSPNEYSSYKAFFKDMFTKVNKQKIDNLIIDIRNNQGGYSGNSSELIRYITNTPFRQYESATRKISKQSLEFYRSCNINLIGLLKQDFDISSLKLSNTGELTPGVFATEAKQVYPVDKQLRFNGKTYVLIGPNVFSSGMLFANTVQHYGIAPLVGEKTRWQLSRQHLGDVVIGTLPHSHLNFMVSTTIFSVSTSSNRRDAYINPDYEVRKSKVSSPKNRDATLEYAIKLVGKTL